MTTKAPALHMNGNGEAEQYYKKGALYYNHENYANAIVCFDKAIEYYEKVNDEKKLVRLLNSKGMALESLGGHIENRSNYFADLNGREISMHTKDITDAYLTDDEALNCFEKALRLKSAIKDADIAEIYMNQGYTFSKREEYEKAIESFQNAKKYAGSADTTDIADIYRNIGYANMKKNYFAENPDPRSYNGAICWLRKSTNLCPKFALAWNTEGYIHTMFEKYEEARKCFAKAIEIDPDFSRA